jgi:uncharacterized protein (TIGR00661 family)
MQHPKRILICPLDWGLGHATRCIPIIRKLLENNAEVLIASDGSCAALLSREFPLIKIIPLKGYEIKYSYNRSMTLQMLLSVPRILNAIRREKAELAEIIEKYRIDVVISDNRYGCWNKKVKSIFITHQLMVKSPFAENILHRIIGSYISKFDECWIPDLPGSNNLSGDLSHKYPIPSNAFFIGSLSRLKPKESNSFENKILAIISGPEPQRSIFERIISEQLFNSGLKSMMVFGLPREIQKVEHKGNILMINHLNSEEMQDAIASSEIIIARSGYSTIMDLAAMNKKAIFIPTPGQTEQEYLAKYLFQKKIAYFQKQSEFDLDSALKGSEKFNGFTGIENNEGLLEARIKAILS